MGDDNEYDFDNLDWQDEQFELFDPSEWGSDQAFIFAKLKRKAKDRWRRFERFSRVMLKPPDAVPVFDKKILCGGQNGAGEGNRLQPLFLLNIL